MRQFKVPTAEMGDVEILLLSPGEWDPCRGLWVDKLVAHVAKADLDHALNGYSKPLVRVLGLPPAGALRKVPVAYRGCAGADRCTLKPSSGCLPASKELGNCYQPSGVPEEAEMLVYQVLMAWREGVYVVVRVEENPDE